MKVSFTDKAEADLEHIADWIGESNPLRAVTFVQELRSCCDGLADMPRRFQIVPGLERAQVRRRPHGDYLILYHVLNDTIEVLHIIHGARDYQRLLGPEDEPPS
ncbi:MAG: type II toxin-antitoxin system RelE/ParE family toxin [Microvirga sp.]|jgi:toxin ParE1/3/4|nr:type II toxin-antitoxin system RelE/ParE family toxin [Beijerinckiaceae bacterium]HZY22666.1 type II toxin-antitoxin system RelE/ParE family toxin [Beijerinckiaceae bacterium]